MPVGAKGTVETRMDGGARFTASQSSSEGTGAPTVPKASPRPYLGILSSAAAPALVLKSDLSPMTHRLDPLSPQ